MGNWAPIDESQISGDQENASEPRVILRKDIGSWTELPSGITPEETVEKAVREGPRQAVEAARSICPTWAGVGGIMGGVAGGVAGSPFGPAGVIAGSGGGAVLGSNLARSIMTPEEYFERPSGDIVREELVNALSAAFPLGGKAFRSLLGKAVGPKAMAGLRGLLAHATGTGVTAAGTGQLLNVATGRPVSKGEAAIEGILGSTFEALPKAFEVAGGPTDLSSPAGKAAVEMFGEAEAKQIPAGIMAAEGSALNRMMRVIGRGGSSSSMRTAAEGLYDMLDKYRKNTITPPLSEISTAQNAPRSVGQVLNDVRMAAQAEGGRLSTAQDTAVSNLIGPDLAAAQKPEASTLVGTTRFMNETEANKAAESVMSAVTPGRTADVSGSDIAPVNIIKNAVRQVGEDLNTLSSHIAAWGGKDPVNMGGVWNNVDDLSKEVLTSIAPPNPHYASTIGRIVEKRKAYSRAGKQFTIADQLQMSKELREAIDGLDPRALREKRNLVLLRNQLKDEVRKNIDSAANAVNDPQTAKSLRDMWDGLNLEYANGTRAAEAFEAASEGGLINPQKLMNEMGARASEMDQIMGIGAMDAATRLSTNPAANLYNKLPAGGETTALYRALKEGNPAAWKLIKGQPGGEEWAIRSFLDDSMKSKKTTTGTAQVTERRYDLSKMVEENRDFFDNLSPNGKGLLQKWIENPAMLEPANLEAVRKIIAATQATPNPVKAVSDLLTSPAVPTDLLQTKLMKDAFKHEAGPMVLSERLDPTGKGTDLARLEQFVQGAETPGYVGVGTMSREKRMALFTPEQNAAIDRMGTLGKHLMNVLNEWPEESHGKIAQIIREGLRFETAASTAAGQIGLRGVPKTGGAVMGAFILTAVPRILKYFATTPNSPQKQRALAALTTFLRQAGTRTSQGASAVVAPKSVIGGQKNGQEQRR